MPVNAEQPPAHTSSSPVGNGSGQQPITDPAHMLPAHASEGGSGKRRTRGSLVRTVLLLLLIALAIAFVVWRILSNKKEQNKEANRATAAANRPTPVQVSPVLEQTVPVYLNALGTVTAYNTVTLHTRVDGQLLQVNFREGQPVHKGQLLLQIDPRPYQAVVDQALGTLSKDEATLKNAEAEAERYTALYQAGVVSKEQQQLQISNAGQSSGSIAVDRAAIEAARVNLGYTRIVSPIEGVVGLRQVDPGNIVHASDSTGLIVITQIHPIAVIFTLPEDQLPQVQAAMKTGNKLIVEAYDRADAHKIAAGTLLTIDNQIDTTTGTAKLKGVFENADNALFSNQFVNVRLVLRQRQNATVIPTAAIQTGAQGSFVYVVNHGPTPSNKLQNQPGGGRRGGGRSRGAASGGSGGEGGTSGSANGAGAADGSGAPDQGSETGQGGTPGRNGERREPFHVDAVTVHVDQALGTSSVLSDGELQTGQLIVIDGAEKLVDGGNVSMAGGAGSSRGRHNGNNQANGPGASTPAPNGTSVSPDTGNADPGSTPRHGHQHRDGGSTPSPGTGGASR